MNSSKNAKINFTFILSELNQFNFLMNNEEINSIVGNFLFKYISIESLYKKMLIQYKERDGKKLKDNEKRKLSVKAGEVINVMNFFNIDINTELIERIFGSNDANYMDCSIKKLRDRLVHNVNENVLRVIIERSNQINDDLNKFIALLKI